MASGRPNINTAKALYKYLVRETGKLPEDAALFYKRSVRHGFEQHADESDPERVKAIIKRAIEDAEWVVRKYKKGAI